MSRNSTAKLRWNKLVAEYRELKSYFVFSNMFIEFYWTDCTNRELNKSRLTTIRYRLIVKYQYFLKKSIQSIKVFVIFGC